MSAGAAPMQDVQDASILDVRRETNSDIPTSYTYTSYKYRSCTSCIPALATLRAARAAGIELRHHQGELRLAADAEPSGELLRALREHKAEIIDLLTGKRCRHCGEPVTREHF